METEKKLPGFYFYSSFFEAIEDLKPREQLALFLAISRYALYGKEPDLKGITATLWKTIKPLINHNRVVKVKIDTRNKNSSKRNNSKTNKNNYIYKDIDKDKNMDMDKNENKNKNKEGERENIKESTPTLEEVKFLLT